MRSMVKSSPAPSRGMDIRDWPTAPRSPWQNGYVERLIGSIRQECLEHLVMFGEAHLRRIVTAYISDFNELRTHLSLNKDAPIHRPDQRFGRIISVPILGDLHHQFCRR
jgi:transposase InsO family protein